MNWFALLYVILVIAAVGGFVFALIGSKVRGKGLEIPIFLLFFVIGTVIFPLTWYRLLFKRDTVKESLASTKDLF